MFDLSIYLPIKDLSIQGAVVEKTYDALILIVWAA
jgi:hypothetical protein